jgi:hypothetical protein
MIWMGNGVKCGDGRRGVNLRGHRQVTIIPVVIGVVLQKN